MSNSTKNGLETTTFPQIELSRAIFIRKGIKLICRIIYHIHKKKLEFYFFQWRKNLRYKISLQRRYFTRWYMLLLKWKLTIHTTVSFWKLIEPTLSRFLSRLNSYWKQIFWMHWLQFDAFTKAKKYNLIRVRLLFRYWKSTVKSRAFMKKVQ